MRVLVVGGAGYIGSHAARTLRLQNHEVVIYDNLSAGHRCLARGFELIEADIADPNALSKVLAKVDAVMHFAADAKVGESVQNPRKYFANNVSKGLQLLNAVIDSPVRLFIFSSSCAIYGEPQKIPIGEDTPRQPTNPYGISKLFFEQALQAYDRAYGLKSASLRYFNAAGADESGGIGELHDPETHLIPSALQAVLGRRPPLEVYGDDYPTPDGTCVRDYIHVNDLAEAHVLALDFIEKNRTSLQLNLGTGNGHSVKQVLETIEQVAGKVPCHIVPRRPGDPPVLVADPRRASQLLGWVPRRSLRDMVHTAWKWTQSCNVGLNETRGLARARNDI